ncbi:MAG TPA: LPXTG cell wall anchor domain-containing protein [Edaphobacter sp.]|jgi:LPXTG-motif cell wall-anchored protein|nr:LPXTG cell wall anchor domain-containing protein [Edaphobacter sp.]
MANAYLNNRRTSIFRAALCTLACAAISAGVWAQDVSSTTVMKGPSTYETTVRSGTVIYVSGNELLVRLPDGTAEHFVVSPTQTFTVDGKQMTISDLKPGTHLTQTITTKTTPKTITTTRTIDGKVWHVSPGSNYVILTLPDGTNKEYNVPKGQVFNISGQQDTIFQLRKGMKVSATVVTEEPVIEASTHRSVTGVAPKAQVPDTTVATLLVESPQQPPQPTQTAAAEPAPTALPKTGSEWPLVGLLGLGSLGAGMLTRRLRLGWK